MMWTQINLAAWKPGVGDLVLTSLVLFIVTYAASQIWALIVAPYKVLSYPGPGIRHAWLGSYPDRHLLTGKIVQALHDSIKQYGRVFGAVHVGRQPVLIVSDHAVAAQIFLKTPWPKVVSNINLLRRFVGRGLLAEEGPVHRRQRKVAYPAFTREAVNAMAGVMLNKCRLLAQHFEQGIQASSTGEPVIDIVHSWNKMALDVIAKVGFGYELNALRDGNTVLESAYERIMRSMLTASLYATLRHRLGPAFEQLGRWLRVPEQVELDDAKAAIAKISRQLIDRAKARHVADGQDGSRESDPGVTGPGASGPAKDLLSLMVRANMSDDLSPKQRLSDEELLAIVPTFLFAGHETSTASLAWASLALTQTEHGLRVQSRLRAEMHRASADAAPDAPAWQSSAEALDALPYLDAVVRELLRVYAPVRYLSRTAARDEVLHLGRSVVLHGVPTRELVVKKGVQVTLPLQHLNTDPEVWGPDGGDFKPERWLPADHEYCTGSQAPQPDIKAVWSSLVTFGLGPSSCIGQRVAILEIKVALATILSEFELLPSCTPPPDFTFIHGIVARPVVVGEEHKGVQVPVRIRKVVH